MIPINVKSGAYNKYNVNFNAKNAKFKIDYHLRISKYRNIFARVYTSYWS